MSESFVVETRGLTKVYKGNIVAVDNLDLRVRRGEVYGFLGPNGAGKTTTLRMLLGLIAPTSGSASVLGQAPGTEASIARVGALVESPAFYPYLSGRDNLRTIARLSTLDASHVERVLVDVEMAERAGDKFKTYSLGMKQRIGVAAALLKDPELLILDEPTNGLDPAGMADMRQLIRRLGQGDRTVLLSSHLLGEVEQICDRAGVIRRGKLVVEGTISELRGAGGLLIRAEPVDRAVEIIGGLDEVEVVDSTDGTLRVSTNPVNAAELNRILVEAGLAVSELRPLQASLEDVFLQLTEEREEAGNAV